VIGLATVRYAPVVWDFAVRNMEAGFTRFAFDLAACRGLDSTFLGVLVGIAQEARDRASRGGWVCAFNVSPANRELFEIVGADRYVRFRPDIALEPVETHSLAGEEVSPAKRLEIVRRAHENLIDIDERNEARFGDFLRCLAAELTKKG
jgi:hypothetical protein